MAKLPAEIEQIQNNRTSTESLLVREEDFRHLDLPETPEQIREHNESIYTSLEELEHCNELNKELLQHLAKSKNNASHTAVELLNKINKQDILPEETKKPRKKN